MIQTANISLYRGDTHIVQLDLTADGAPVDLSGAVLALDIYPADGGEPLRPEIAVQGNLVILYFPALLTHDLRWERGIFDLRAVYGGVVKTYLRGSVFIKPSITPVAGLITEGGRAPLEEYIEVDVSGQAVVVRAGDSGGAAGAPGADGAPGKDGLSAYEIAVRNGFAGSEPEWLASLRGERGADGAPGQDGAAAGYAEYQEGYIARADFIGSIANSTLVTVKFPQPFSRRPEGFTATLDIVDSNVRVQYINNVTAEGFSVGTNYAGSLQGVWYRAYIK